MMKDYNLAIIKADFDKGTATIDLMKLSEYNRSVSLQERLLDGKLVSGNSWYVDTPDALIQAFDDEQLAIDYVVEYCVCNNGLDTKVTYSPSFDMTNQGYANKHGWECKNVEDIPQPVKDDSIEDYGSDKEFGED